MKVSTSTFRAFAALLIACACAAPAHAAPHILHSADTDANHAISLGELLRVVQFFNSPGLHCEAGTEDGYAPGPGDTSCAPHDSDYNPQDWTITLNELLRLIQFYNYAHYFAYCGTEDSFAPGSGTDQPCVAEGEGEGEGLTMIYVPAGAFEMGDPFNEGRSNELPVHTVYLDAYYIGKYDVTNQQYADVLNWANAQGYLTNSSGGAYTGGLVYAHGQPVADTSASSTDSAIEFSGGIFTVQIHTGAGGQSFSMATHPVVEVLWYGSVAYCNWRSEIEGLQPCYNFTDWTRYKPVRNGYRLPTEAEWERAAAWDGSRHWRYGFTSDMIDITRANYHKWLTDGNPLGLTTFPYTSPVGWFDGVNVSPNGNVQTVNSQSSVGAYDMSGNVWQWCEDWYDSAYYGISPGSNPQGAASGTERVLRGGASYNTDVRAAYRTGAYPDTRYGFGYGLRVARTP